MVTNWTQGQTSGANICWARWLFLPSQIVCWLVDKVKRRKTKSLYLISWELFWSFKIHHPWNKWWVSTVRCWNDRFICRQELSSPFTFKDDASSSRERKKAEVMDVMNTNQPQKIFKIFLKSFEWDLLTKEFDLPTNHRNYLTSSRYYFNEIFQVVMMPPFIAPKTEMKVKELRSNKFTH